MGSPDTTTSSGPIPPDYLSASKRPLQMLAFLLPLIALYELGLAVVLRSERTNLAHRTLLDAFEVFGVPTRGGLYLGGVLIVAVLLVWHALERRPWKASGRIGVIMAGEALLLAAPLILIGQAASGLAAPPPAAGAGTTWDQLDLGSKMVMSVGAGLYEELLFRMVLIAVVHTLLVDVMKASDWLGSSLAVIVSAGAFTWYHELDGSLARAAFFFAAGLYLGGVFMLRGFGIVVGAHAAYDVLTAAAQELAA